MTPQDCLARAQQLRKDAQGYANIVDNLLVYKLADHSASVNCYSLDKLVIYWDKTRASMLEFNKLDWLLTLPQDDARQYLKDNPYIFDGAHE